MSPPNAPAINNHVTLLTSLSTLQRAPKWTLGSRDTIKGMAKSMSAPGPGAYGNPKDTRFNRQPAATLGSGEREPQFTSMKKPGPDKYNPNMRSILADAPRWSMGSGQRAPLNGKSITPGPGNYAIPSGLSRVSAPMIQRRADPTERRSITPGPGKYDMDRSLQGLAWKMGTEERKSMARRSLAPGPGAYPLATTIGNRNHPEKSNAPAYSMKPRRDPFKNFKDNGVGNLYTTFG